RQAVFLHRFQLGTLGIFPVILARPFGHLGILCCLTIDRPRSAVVMRRGYARFVIDVCEDLEAKLWILVNHLQSACSVVTAILLKEISVAEQPLEILTHLLAARGARITRKDRTAIGDKLIKIVRHDTLPGVVSTAVLRKSAFLSSSAGSAISKTARRL